MSYEPKLPPSTQHKITEYLEQRYRTRESYLRAIDEIQQSLVKLAVNPRQAISPPGLFETRPLHRFHIHADGVRREVQVAFIYDAEDKAERTIVIVDFLAITD